MFKKIISKVLIYSFIFSCSFDCFATSLYDYSNILKDYGNLLNGVANLYDDIYINNDNLEKQNGENIATRSNISFKQMMDNYESFFDDYIAFMKKYKERKNDISLFSDYLDFLSKYTKKLSEMNNIKTDDLSKEDYKYYIDVTARISKKLLDVVN